MDIKQDETNRLIQLAFALNIPDDSLDEYVHDAAQEGSLGKLNETDNEDEQEDTISRSEQYASFVNNGGFWSQIRYLIEFTPPEVLEQCIRSASAQTPDPSPSTAVSDATTS